MAQDDTFFKNAMVTAESSARDRSDQTWMGQHSFFRLRERAGGET
ncbi:hypothetical protein [Devosia oryzisoli]|nr:hypothetical protein [Devosia oryzisoli]